MRLVVKLTGNPWICRLPLENDADVEILTLDSEAGLRDVSSQHSAFDGSSD